MRQYQHTGHILKRNHANAIPRYIICVDTETVASSDSGSNDRRTHSLRLGVAVSARMVGTKPVGTKCHHFGTRESFWNIVRKITAPNYTTWIVGHNILFDLIVLGMPEKFESAELVIEWPRTRRTKEDNNVDNRHCHTLCIIDSPPTIIAAKYVPTGGRIVFIDTLNYFQFKLAVLGETIGLPKLDMPDVSESDDVWATYCQRDAYIVFEAFTKLIQWVRDKDLGVFRYTAASQSMSAYRHRFMHRQIYMHDNDDVKALERRSYFGGRVEVFRIGQLDRVVHQLDVNSLFPSVMRHNQYPCKLEFCEMRRDSVEMRSIDNALNCIADVEIETELPIFPLRVRQGTIYPIGRFHTTLCGPELSLASRMGLIRSVRSMAYYSLARIFDEWVDGLSSMRIEYLEDGNVIYAEFTKRLMNSLYGKFGQRSHQWQNVPDIVAAIPWSQWHKIDLCTGERISYRSIGWTVQQLCDRHEISGTFPAISSYVSSYARIFMNKIRNIAGDKDIYYQGVDSVVVTSDGKQRLSDAGLLHDTSLGCLRLQVSTDSGEILGCNDYTIGDKIVISGRAFDYDLLSDGTIIQKTFNVSNRLFSGVSVDTVEEVSKSWNRVSAYWKGNIQADGWIDPFVISTPDSGSIDGVNDESADSAANESTV